MRIVYGTDHVSEITDITAVRAWKPSGGETSENPGTYSLMIDDEYVGEYILDGTEETYRNAVRNFEGICKKLLVKGYCMDDDFDNFEWY